MPRAKKPAACSVAGHYFGLQGMIALLEKIRSLAKGESRHHGTPFVSVKATRKWLVNLPGASDYDIHHTLVEGLERFNGDTRGDAKMRIKVLMMIEEAGLPLQTRLIAQYLESHEKNNVSRQQLWRECHLFWDQLTVAHLGFLNMVLRGSSVPEGLSSLAVQIAVKSLRYFSLGMRWEYLRGRRPNESAWRRLHKIYRALESAGLALDCVKVEGRETSCAREYVMTLLFDLANPYAFDQREIRLALDLLEGLQGLPVPEVNLRHGRHSHMVDLTATAGPERIDDRWVPGGRLRYLDFICVVKELEQRAARAPDTPHAEVCRKLAKVIERAGISRSGPRKPRLGELRAVFGAQDVLRICSAGFGVVKSDDYVTLRDESSKGMGFVLHEERELAPGSLLAVDRDGGHGDWQVLAVRWQSAEDGQWLLGAEVLSRYPKRVEVEWQAGDSGKQTAVALYLPLAAASQGTTSNLLLPQEAYEAGRELLLRQDDGTRYRLRLAAIIETHESWQRAGFDVLSREAA